MTRLYDSGLFSELGDLLGHDPVFYEESDVSSFSGDIRKLPSSCTSTNPVFDNDTVSSFPELLESQIDQSAELDTLINEGNMLLDKLMAENGLGIDVYPTDLGDIDELLQQTDDSYFTAPSNDDLFVSLYTNSKLDAPTVSPVNTLPASPVSTLPSEPQTPINLFEYDACSSPVNADVQQQTSSELDDLLSSILEDTGSPLSEMYDDPSYSPVSYCSSDSPNSRSLSPSCSEEEFTFTSDSSSSPGKSKPKKKKSTPYSKLPSGRKERKKLQNKEAAIRYRQKKKNETQELSNVEAQLSGRNSELKAEVLNLEREIMCMKELLSDVFNVHSFT